jgi:hypothetical protein
MLNRENNVSEFILNIQRFCRQLFLRFRRFPPDWHQQAIDRGADLLIADAPHTLQDQPKALLAAQRIYQKCCIDIFRLAHRKCRRPA